jgi:hypothetical protein
MDEGVLRWPLVYFDRGGVDFTLSAAERVLA